MCFGKIVVTLLTLPWLNNAMNRREIEMLNGNNTVFILYKTPPDGPHHQLWQVLEHIQKEIAQHTSTCTPGETSICIKKNQVACGTAHVLIISLNDFPGQMQTEIFQYILLTHMVMA